MQACPECEQLFGSWADAAATLARVQSELATYKSGGAPDGFSGIWEACGAARQQFEEFRGQVIEHLKAHRNY
jgi:hypothetical protein